MLKKFRYAFLSGLLISTLGVTNSVNAESSSSLTEDELIIFKNDEITDYNILYKRALQGISDDPTIDEMLQTDVSITKVSEKSTLRQEKKETLNTETLSTTEHLESKVEEDGTLVDEFVTTLFNKTEVWTEEEPHFSTFDDAGKGELDPTYSVYTSTRIYFTRGTTSDGNRTYKMSSITGSMTPQEGSISLSNRKIIVAQIGPGTNSQRYEKSISSNSFSETVPSTWKPAEYTNFTIVGVNVQATIKQGSTSWNFVYQHNIARP